MDRDAPSRHTPAPFELPSINQADELLYFRQEAPMTGIGNHEYPPQWWEASTSQVSYRRDRTSLTLLLAGELDAFSCVATYRQVRDILTDPGYSRVTLDLADVDFCDCAGVRALIAMHYLATDRGASCVLENPQGHVMWLLRELRAPDTLVVTFPLPSSRS
jgi:anti-anti-sigma factor